MVIWTFWRWGEEEIGVGSDEVLRGRLKNSQTLQNLGVLVDHLDCDKCDELVALIRSYPGLFSDTLTSDTA